MKKCALLLAVFLWGAFAAPAGAQTEVCLSSPVSLVCPTCPVPLRCYTVEDWLDFFLPGWNPGQ